MNNVEIKEITDQQIWTTFFHTVSPNTFLHSWQWGELQQKTGENIKRLGIYQNSILEGIALVITVNAKRGRHYLIPHGPIFSLKTSPNTLLPVLIEYLKKQGKKEKVLALRIAPLLIDNKENNKLFKDLKFKNAPLHVHTELTWMLDISKTEEEILQEMRKTTRHAIKKAAQETEIEISTSLDVLNRFFPLYNQTKQRHGFIPFSKSFLNKQLASFTNDFYAVIGRYKNKDIAIAILIRSNNTVFYHHGASIKNEDNIPVAQLVQWEAIKHAKKLGATKYNFWGIAPDNKPDHPFAGITVFKKGFGGYAIDYLHAQDLPLSLGYTKLWLIDYIRKIKRGF